jgi:hypothetical protein
MDVTSRGRNSEQGPAVMPSASFSKGRKEGRWRRLSESHSAESVRGRNCGGGTKAESEAVVVVDSVRDEASTGWCSQVVLGPFGSV